MGILDDIKKLMENLKESEEEKNRANEEMQKVMRNCIKEIIDIFLKLSDYIKIDNIVLRSYMGKIFEIGEGIIIFDKNIEEKLILRPDGTIHYYRIVNEDLIDIPLNEKNITDYITIDALFDSVKTALINCINKNQQQILNYRSITAKINRYTEDLERIIKTRLEQNEKPSDKNKSPGTDTNNTN